MKAETDGLIIACGTLVHNCSVNYIFQTFANKVQLQLNHSYTLYWHKSAEDKLTYYISTTLYLDSRTIGMWEFNHTGINLTGVVLTINKIINILNYTFGQPYFPVMFEKFQEQNLLISYIAPVLGLLFILVSVLFIAFACKKCHKINGMCMIKKHA